MDLIGIFLLTLLSALICICLPKVIVLLRSMNAAKSEKFTSHSLHDSFTSPSAQSQLELSQAESYPELSAVSR